MAGYVKLGSIEGESIEPNHSGWINLLSVSQGISRPLSAGASGSTRQRSSASLEDIALTKEVDKSTPKLAEAICTGVNFPKVEIHLCTSSEGGERIPYFKAVCWLSSTSAQLGWPLTESWAADFMTCG